VDVSIDVKGGGVMGQAEAVRTALARGIVKWHNDPQIKDIYVAYDRALLVNDSRQKEAKKPHGRGARKKFQKSYR
jgi:small subunit ribosomal protein S9